MKVTPKTSKILSIRRERRDMLKAGWEFVGEDGGNLWQLYRGGRYRERIYDVKIAACGMALWIKTCPIEQCDALTKHRSDSVQGIRQMTEPSDSATTNPTAGVGLPNNLASGVKGE